MTTLIPGRGFSGFKCASATGTNAAVTITLTGVAGQKHYIGAVLWSYSQAPGTGNLISTGLDGNQVDMDITVGGPGPIGLPPAKGTDGANVTFTLAAGGSGVVGKLMVWYLPSTL